MAREYYSKRKISQKIKSVVAKIHKLKPTDILLNWLTNWELVTYPTGLIGMTGKIRLHAAGYKPAIFDIFQQPGQKWNMR